MLLAILLATMLAPHDAAPVEVAAPAGYGFDSTLVCYDAVKSRGNGSPTVDGVFLLSKSRDEVMARDAVDVLAMLGTGDARAALAVVLCSASDPRLRARAADRLGDVGGPDAAFLLALDADLETNPEVLDVIVANLEKVAIALPELPASAEPRALVAARRAVRKKKPDASRIQVSSAATPSPRS